jgi:uncharacterized membrane protein YGL010W
VDRDTVAFGLLIGLPILAVSGLVAKLLLELLGRGVAIALCVVLILAWPLYYVAVTIADPGFAEGLPLLLYTSPPMILGLVLAMAWARGRRRR